MNLRITPVRPLHPINIKKWEKHLADRYVILFRAHHITTQIMGIEFNDFILEISKSVSIFIIEHRVLTHLLTTGEKIIVLSSKPETSNLKVL